MSRSQTERQQINRFLGRAGLAQLDEPTALIQQIGTLIQDHDHFRRLLSKCDPEQRYQMYEAISPNLCFRPKTLGEYMIESAQMAEERQFPVLAPDGTLLPFRKPEVETDEYRAECAIADALAKERLWLMCRKCTREEVFSGERKIDAVAAARAAGWTYDEVRGVGHEVCPNCP